jgi:8-oxo-dGTP diphosphatase
LSGDDRRYPRHPLPGVGAILLDGERVLMARRGKEPLKGWWSLPGGLLEVGESLSDAVRREVREETGLEIEILGVFEIFERIMRDGAGQPEYHYVLIDYLCRAAGGDLRPGDDVCEVKWARREELGDLQITEGTLAVIERAFCGADPLVCGGPPGPPFDSAETSATAGPGGPAQTRGSAPQKTGEKVKE